MKKYIMVDMDDSRVKDIAEVMGNRSCKKILSLLANKDMSASEIAESFKMPLNTITYNLDKLARSGLIEENKGFFWSSKGKRILRYRLSDKKILISPRSSFRIVPALVVSGILGLGMKLFLSERSNIALSEPTSRDMFASAPEKIDVGAVVAYSTGNELVWFIFGIIVFLLALAIFNWRKIW